jgi:PAS domain S-box-containing protein
MTDPFRKNQELLEENSSLKQRIQELEKSEAELNRIEDTMQEAERVKSELLDKMNEAQHIAMIGSWEWNLKTNHVWWSDETYRIFGVTQQDFVPSFEANGKFLHPDDFGRYGKSFEQSLKTGKPLDFDFRLIANDGLLKHCHARGKNICDDSGQPIRFIGTIMDISVRKQAEEKIQNSEIFLNRLIEQSPIAMWISDDRGSLIRLNQACCNLLNITADEVVDRYNIFQDNIVKEQGFLPLVKAVFERGETAHFEIDYNSSHVEGLKLHWTVAVILDVTIFPIKDTHGRITHAVIQDINITERRQAAEALRLKNLVFDASIAANSIADLDGIITEANDTFLRVWAYPCKDEVVGKPLPHFLNDPHEAAAIVTALNNIGQWEGDYTAKRKDGSTFIAHGLATVIRNENDKVIGYQSAVMDITEQKQAEEALKKSEEMLRLVSENMSDMIRVTDLQGNNLYASPSHFKGLGYTPEERVGKTGFDIMHPDDVEMVINRFTEGLAGKQKHIKAEYRVMHADGHYLWLETIGDIITDAQGKPNTVIMSSRDITERKRRENEILELSLTNQRILDSAGEGIYGLDLNSNVTFINVAGAKMLGWEIKDIIGKNSHQVWHHTRADGTAYPEEECGLKEILKSGVGKTYIEDWFWKKDGDGFPVEYTNNPIYKEDSLIGAVVTFKDITVRKQDIQKVRKALETTIQAIASLVETRDAYTAGHQRRVADIATAIATDMGLTKDQIDGLRTASTIHDIGKISVPAEILTKPTKLSAIEFNLIKTHAQSGYDILKDIEFPWPIARIILEHHERIDGSGYPHGLMGEQVLLESKILAVADAVEAIASDRPYRSARGIDVALEEIEKNKGSIYDNVVADVCLRLFQEKGFQLENP